MERRDDDDENDDSFHIPKVSLVQISNPGLMLGGYVQLSIPYYYCHWVAGTFLLQILQQLKDALPKWAGNAQGDQEVPSFSY